MSCFRLVLQSQLTRLWYPCYMRVCLLWSRFRSSSLESRRWADWICWIHCSMHGTLGLWGDLEPRPSLQCLDKSMSFSYPMRFKTFHLSHDLAILDVLTSMNPSYLSAMSCNTLVIIFIFICLFASTRSHILHMCESCICNIYGWNMLIISIYNARILGCFKIENR